MLDGPASQHVRRSEDLHGEEVGGVGVLGQAADLVHVRGALAHGPPEIAGGGVVHERFLGGRGGRIETPRGGFVANGTRCRGRVDLTAVGNVVLGLVLVHTMEI